MQPHSGNGRSSSIAAMIVATAVVHRLTVVTRNVRDFDQLRVDLLNPFEHESDVRLEESQP